jgi:hypothetical protein
MQSILQMAAICYVEWKRYYQSDKYDFGMFLELSYQFGEKSYHNYVGNLELKYNF